jgi:hypothetical protein
MTETAIAKQIAQSELQRRILVCKLLGKPRAGVDLIQLYVPESVSGHLVARRLDKSWQKAGRKQVLSD